MKKAPPQVATEPFCSFYSFYPRLEGWTFLFMKSGIDTWHCSPYDFV